MNLDDCLPPQLVGATISKLSFGMSGAGVYRVEKDGAVYVLKVASENDLALATFETMVTALKAGSAFGIAPGLVHVDYERRAVVTELVVDQNLMRLYGQPTTRAQALSLIASTLRRLHTLAIPPTAATIKPSLMATQLRSRVTLALPAWATAVIDAAIAMQPPPDDSRVLSHNDVNPTNLCFDGERLLLLDWDTVGANDRYYDLASIAMWLRMDDAACLALLSAHDGVPVTELPARFVHDRKFIAALCGIGFLYSATRAGHPGDANAAPVGLADIYAQLRVGQFDPTSRDGRWTFALALLDEAARL